MNELFVRIHYFEQDDECDDFVKFVVPTNITQSELLSTIDIVKSEFQRDDYDLFVIADAILDETAKKLQGFWAYVGDCASIIIGDNR